MSNPNGFGPQYPGPVNAQGFVSTIKQHAVPQKLVVSTNGTTKVDVFGTTNPVSGTILSVKTISQDTTAGFVTVTKNDAGSEVTVANAIVKGNVIGTVAGTAMSAVAFAKGGTMTVVSSSSGNATVEIDFIISDPRLPGAQ